MKLSPRKITIAVKLAVLIFVLSNLPGSLSAQPDGGGPGGTPPPVPITGIELLLAAGGLFGAKKLYDSQKQKKNG